MGGRLGFIPTIFLKLLYKSFYSNKGVGRLYPQYRDVPSNFKTVPPGLSRDLHTLQQKGSSILLSQLGLA